MPQNLQIISKKFQFSTRRTRILMGFIMSTIYHVVLISNSISRIVVRLKRFKKNLEILCHLQLAVTPKTTNHLFTCYLNRMCRSNPVCLIKQWSVIILLGSYVQWPHFFVWQNWPIYFFPSIFTLSMYVVECFNSWNEWIDFCTTI